jgi:hypothetical protein
MGLVGPNGLFWFLAVVHAGVGVFALYRMTQRRAVPLDEQGHCVAIPATASQVAMAMVQETAVGDTDRAVESQVEAKIS